MILFDFLGLLEYIFHDKSLDQLAIIIMTFIVIATILLVIDNGIICSRMMRDNNSLDRNPEVILRIIFFLNLLPFFVFFIKIANVRKQWEM